MLVLSRKKNEQIRIGDDIVITVIEIRGDKIKLGINAPKNVSVHRQEIYDAINGLHVGDVVQYEGLREALIVAQVEPLVLVGVLGNSIYTTIHKDSLNVISHQGSGWTDTYPAAYQKWMKHVGV